MKKNHVLMVLAVLLLMPAFLFAGGTTEVSEEMGPVTLWSEVNIKAPQTNLDENFAKAVEGIEEAMGTELIVVTTPYKEIDAKMGFVFDLPRFNYRLTLSLGIVRFRAPVARSVLKPPPVSMIRVSTMILTARKCLIRLLSIP